ncbi:DEAD/DEAH box helicase family protein [Clostridium tyrobutyricum]|uniref:DEAD/DEAH box helicase family protein n=1 Tax=Clostridium tyrobutyricum TaxID=1519 RepID=UPI00073D5562|nr:DEAD/DEAH box helicase family protein [Clostridium tyrobutyricum]
MPFKYNPNYFFTVKPHIYDNENLREPQIRGYYSIYEHFEINKKVSHAIMVLPTGVGKTGLMALLPYNISRGRVLIIAPQIVVKDTVIDALNPELPDNFWLKRKVFEKVSDLPAVIEFEGNKTKLEVLEAANIVVMNIQKLQKRLEQTEGQNSDIKRPDKYFATKRKNIDLDIKEKIVPCIITDLNIEQKANNLKNCRLFTNRYRWIPKRIKDNGGMLAVYFSSYLNNEIGYKRDSWTIDDYNIAYDKLPQCIEYVKNVLADYLNL